jgi:hypothetical protein
VIALPLLEDGDTGPISLALSTLIISVSLVPDFIFIFVNVARRQFSLGFVSDHGIPDFCYLFSSGFILSILYRGVKPGKSAYLNRKKHSNSFFSVAGVGACGLFLARGCRRGVDENMLMNVPVASIYKIQYVGLV